MTKKREFSWFDLYTFENVCQCKRIHRSPETALNCPAVRNPNRFLMLRVLVEDKIMPGIYRRELLTNKESKRLHVALTERRKHAALGATFN